MLGVCFLPNCQLPVMLMEISTIHSGGRIQVPSLPAQTHFSNPHRDLMVKNVLLNMSKITDIMGDFRIVNLQPGQLARTLSRLATRDTGLATCLPRLFHRHLAMAPALTSSHLVIWLSLLSHRYSRGKMGGGGGGGGGAASAFHFGNRGFEPPPLHFITCPYYKITAT